MVPTMFYEPKKYMVILNVENYGVMLAMISPNQPNTKLKGRSINYTCYA